MTETVSTFLFEKNALLREGLKSFLSGTRFTVTGEFACAVDMGEIDANAPPQLIIIGIDRHSEPALKNSAECMQKISRLKAQFPQARLVILMSQEDLISSPDILSWNADSYILRDISHDALLNYLNLVMMGEKILPAKFAPLFANTHSEQASGGVVPLNRNGYQLSDRETDIIKCLIQGDSNKLIAQHLHIAEATVKVHLKTILRKLGVHNRTQVALWAVSHGFSVDIQGSARNDDAAPMRLKETA